jgi:divalent metal cation (Fe/Co/Zn/Cd) transporter
MAGQSLELPLIQPTAPPRDHGPLVRRARRLAWLGIGWHVAEAAIAIAAGLAATSIALIGFGADSFVESVAGLIVVWRFAERRRDSESAERRAQRLIGASFAVIGVYVGVEAVRSLIAGTHPQASWVGIGLAAVTVVAMPLLARAKARVGDELHSSATVSEGRQNLLCGFMSAGLLVGLGANALFGWWWADPVTAFAIAGIALYEGREAWRGNACCDVC